MHLEPAEILLWRIFHTRRPSKARLGAPTRPGRAAAGRPGPLRHPRPACAGHGSLMASNGRDLGGMPQGAPSRTPERDRGRRAAAQLAERAALLQPDAPDGRTAHRAARRGRLAGHRRRTESLGRVGRCVECVWDGMRAEAARGNSKGRAGRAGHLMSGGISMLDRELPGGRWVPASIPPDTRSPPSTPRSL